MGPIKEIAIGIEFVDKVKVADYFFFIHLYFHLYLDVKALAK